MASATKAYKVKKRTKSKNAGRDRKKELAKQGSTPSAAVLFGDVPADK